jgi:hypothetical protein
MPEHLRQIIALGGGGFSMDPPQLSVTGCPEAVARGNP